MILIFTKIFEEYRDINNLVKTENKNNDNLSKFNKYHLNNIDNKKEFENILRNRINFKKIYHYLAERFFSYIEIPILIENNVDLKLNYFKKKFF